MDFREIWQARERARHEAHLAEMQPIVAWARAYWIGHQVWWMHPLQGCGVCYGWIDSVDERGWLQVIDSYDVQGQPRFLRRHVSDLDHTLFLLPEETSV